MGLFVRLIEMECSNCGGRLKKVDKKLYKCPYCEATFLVAEVKRQRKAAKKEQKKNNNQLPKEQVRDKTRSGWIPTILVYLAIIGVIIFLCIMSEKENTNKNTLEYSSEISESVEFKRFAEWIFEKDYDEITDEEFKSVTEVSLMGYGGFLSVDCVVAGEKISFGFDSYIDNVMDGISRFENLNVLAVSTSLSTKNLKGLNNLTRLTCLNCIDELAKMLPHPEKITHLSNVLYDEGTEGLDKFTNLKSLHIRSVFLSDISGLGKLKNLEEISIVTYDKVKNFAIFSEMKNLKSICIDSENIDSLEFVRNLKNLESLKITGGKLNSIEPIKGMTNLKELSLEKCILINDFEVINTLTGLEKICIYARNAENQIQWNKLTNLKSVHVESFSNSNFIEELPKMQQLELLYLESGSSDDIGAISRLTNLKTLTIEGVKNADLSVLSDLINLETVNICDVESGRSGETIFNLPNVKTITVANSSIGMNTNKVNENNVLENLSITYSGINSYQASYSGFKLVFDLNDNIDFVGRLKGLKTLRIQGGELEDINFIENLSQLEMLDVSDNYVSDVSPVERCTKLRELICRDNALEEIPELGRNVGVDMRNE